MTESAHLNSSDATVGVFVSDIASRHKTCSRLVVPYSWLHRVQKLTESWCTKKSCDVDDEVVMVPQTAEYLGVICIKANSDLLDIVLVTHEFLAASVNATNERDSSSQDHQPNSQQTLADVLQIKTKSETNGNVIKHTNGHTPSLSPASSVDSLCDMDMNPFVEVNVYYCNCLQFSMNSNLAGCVVKACCISPTFCHRLLQYIRHKNKLYDNKRRHTQKKLSQFSHLEHWENWNSRYFFQISVENVSKHWLDYKWCHRIGSQVYKRIILDEAMSWLNTLGGGFSALGDYFHQHAEKAGKISICQLKIAMEIGDPPTVIRCRLYFAQSQMQRGFLRQAKHIIRHEFHLAKKLPIEDKRLLAMCHGLWSRLQFLYARRYARTSASKKHRSLRLVH